MLQPTNAPGLTSRLRGSWNSVLARTAGAWRRIPAERRSALVSLAVLSGLLALLAVLGRNPTAPPHRAQPGPQPAGLGAVQPPGPSDAEPAAPATTAPAAAADTVPSTPDIAPSAPEIAPAEPDMAPAVPEPAAEPEAASAALADLGRPVDGRAHGGYGMAYVAILGEWRIHPGIDYHAAPGAPVHAAAPGTVQAVETHPLYGLSITIDHGSGLVTRYAPVGEPRVQPGDRVTAGADIGAVGAPGPAEPDAGPHLHFEVWQSGEPVPPPPALR